MSGFLTLFTQRVRGVRVLDLAAACLLLVIALSSYAFKTLAEAQDAGAADVQAQIDKESRRVRLLRAEISHLEAPGRVEQLATDNLGMAAVDPHHEIAVADIARIASEAPPPTEPKAKTP